MPHVGGDGGGGGGGSAERSPEQNAGFGSWLGGTTRTMTGGATGNYVVLGGTRYGLRLSQVS